MVPRRSRRSVLKTAVLGGVAASTGCLSSLFDGSEPGSIFVDNEHEDAHTVRVTITKTDDEGSGTEPQGETPGPETTPLSKWKFTKTVDGTERVLLTVLDGVGLYYIEARLDSRTIGFWLRLFEDADGGVSGGSASVVIHENGRLGMTVSSGE